MPFCGADEEAGDEEERWADNFAAFVTSTYAGLQSRAAEKCGVLPGEAWRTAMEAAAMAGARQVRGSCRPAPCMRPRCVLASLSLQQQAPGHLATGACAAYSEADALRCPKLLGN